MNRQQEREIQRLLFDNEFNQDSQPPEDNTVFRMHFKRVGSLGDYILLTGKKSSGKTKVVSGGIAAGLTGIEIFKFHIKLPPGKRKVAHFDTEQGRGSHYRMMQLIMKFGALERLPEHFKSYRCRCIAPHLIKLMIEHYLAINPECGLIFLDGMLDTVASMNDEKQANIMKQWLQTISEQHNVLFVGVIHRGFSADKAIGHIGSYLERGAQTVLKIDRVNKEGLEYFVISTEYIRDDAMPPDTAFYFNRNTNEWELFEIAAETIGQDQQTPKSGKNSPLQYDIMEHGRRLRQIFDPSGQFLSWDRLVQEIQIAYGCTRTDARGSFYQYLLSEGLIYKTESGYTNLKKIHLFAEK
jgi:hypothetical protein